jgi:hypothetical protein
MISILSYYTARFSGMQRPGTSYLMIPVYTYIRAYNIALLFSWLPTFNAVSMRYDNRWLYPSSSPDLGTASGWDVLAVQGLPASPYNSQ